jgi:hypothetical protein
MSPSSLRCAPETFLEEPEAPEDMARLFLLKCQTCDLASEMFWFSCLNDEATVSDIACRRASVAINELIMSEL